MYVVDLDNNDMNKVQEKTFHELGFKERENLQEWIAKNPECLGDEEFLIIQKEFDGFNDTNERLDLLALDKNGRLVVIENKLDDTGKNVVWQVLKYVSYCSTLSKTQIIEIFQSYLDKNSPGKNAAEELEDFFDGRAIEEISLNDEDQRIIMVAGKFRKEVTSTVMWMLNHSIDVQCFKVTPHQHNDMIFLDIEQIIPVKETEDYIIQMADKAKESQTIKVSNSGIKEIRLTYWKKLLDEFIKHSTIFQNVNGTTDHWISAGSGVSGIPFSFVITKKYASVEMSIYAGTKEENKEIYDRLYEVKEDIEKDFGQELEWERLDDKKTCRITSRLYDVDCTNIDDWNKMIKFQCDAMPRLYKALHDRTLKVAKKH